MYKYRVKLTPIYFCNECGSYLKDGWHVSPNTIRWYCKNCGHTQREKEAPTKFVNPEEYFNANKQGCNNENHSH